MPRYPGFQSSNTSGRNAVNFRIRIPLLLILIGISTLAQASTPSASSGKAISGMCAACHGSNGTAIVSSYPNLAGQNYPYLLQQLKAFKSGQRNNAIMHSMTSDLSKQQMQDLAAYYASLDHRTCKSDKGLKTNSKGVSK